MTIECLCSVKINNCNEIAVHPEANFYDCKYGNIRFFKVNPRPSERMKPIPGGANTLRVSNYRDNRMWIYYRGIEFISHRGNILKTEDYN